MGSDDSASETVSTIETDSVTTRRTVYLDLAGIWCKALRRVFCGDTALEGKSSCGDVVLGQTKLLERCTCGDLDLCSYNIDACHFFGDGVLNLNTRVDLNEVVTVLLVNQELRSACIAVFDGLSKSDGISQNGVTGLDREVLCWGNLDNLLVTTLHRAVTLVQVDDVTEIVTEQLDFNVLGPVEEALDEDCAVAKSRLRF
jgi:hypothetical protein